MAQFEIKDGIVIILEGVTSLPDWAFVDNCSIIESLNIPKSVDSIGQYTFSDCPNMTSIIVSEDNEVYDSRNGCNAIIETDTNKLIVGCKTTVIPDSVTSIGDYAFNYCSGLASVTIPNSVISIGDGAFSGCSGLASIKVSEDNDVYDSRNSCNAIIETATNKLIVGCKTTVIPDSVTSIGNYAFNDCSDLKSITIPASVTSICDYTFSGCSGLVSIKVSEDNKVYDSRNGCNAIIETDTNKLIVGCKTTVIPDSVTSIGDYAFFNCSDLKSITIPDSITSIGDYAFFFCSALTSITIPDSVISIGDGAFYGCSGLASITIPDSVTSIGDYAFFNCSNLTNITIPDSVNSIGEMAFYCCSGLSSVTIGKSVISIGEMAFKGCSGLTRITISNSVTSIGESAFQNCTSLTSVDIPNSVTSIEDWAFSGCSELVSIKVSEDNEVYDSRNGCNAIIETDTNKLVVGCKTTVIPNSVTSIGDWAFSGCSELVSIKVSEDNEVYDSRNGCNAIIETDTNTLIVGSKTTVIPDSVTSI